MIEAVIEIPARRGKAAHVARGQHVKVINTHGEQVVDTWAFNRANPSEFLSMEHTRAHTLRIVPRVGDMLRTNQRRPILTLVEDTSGGIHDTLIAACDRSVTPSSASRATMTTAPTISPPPWPSSGGTAPHVPSPLNLFMNIPWSQEGGLSFAAPPKSVPGGYVLLRAEMDLVIAFSACPQDVLPINGRAGRTVEAHFTIT